MKKDSALVVVDMLYDFIDGSMACLNADNAVAASLQWIDRETAGAADLDESGIHSTLPILFVCDHHPADHCSFAAQGGPWPPHCVQDTHGGAIHEALLPHAREEFTFYKGENQALEQYSGFEGVNAAGQTLGEVLALMDIRTVYVCGIATEYCVRNTAEDLLKAGFRVTVLKDCIAYVDRNGHEEALAAMKAEGIRLA
jgi:nicotinamidase-related amidase